MCAHEQAAEHRNQQGEGQREFIGNGTLGRNHADKIDRGAAAQVKIAFDQQQHQP